MLPQNTNITIWPDKGIGDTNYYQTYPYYIYVEPKVCSETIHVFPCKHCGKCQCGKVALPKK